MTEPAQAKQLREAFDKYRTPDPKIVDKLPRGGASLDYVGHAETTAVLIDIDPLWSWEPRAWDDETGGPKVYQRGGHLMMWGYLTLLGKTMPCVGTCEAKKADRSDVEKELIGDLLRNGAMRFGIFVDLWAKDHPEADLPERPARQTAQVGHGKDSPRWQATAEALRGLDADSRNLVVQDSIVRGTFNADRTPKFPLSSADMDALEKHIAAVSREARDDHDNDAVVPRQEVTDTLSPPHPSHAVDTMHEALGVDVLPDEIDPVFWFLAEHADPGEIDWTRVHTDLHVTKKVVLDHAKACAAKIGVEAPTSLNDPAVPIVGALAHELRAELIRDTMGDPY